MPPSAAVRRADLAAERAETEAGGEGHGVAVAPQFPPLRVLGGAARGMAHSGFARIHKHPLAISERERTLTTNRDRDGECIRP